jgi:hypothetical protein
MSLAQEGLPVSGGHSLNGGIASLPYHMMRQETFADLRRKHGYGSAMIETHIFSWKLRHAVIF